MSLCIIHLRKLRLTLLHHGSVIGHTPHIRAKTKESRIFQQRVVTLIPMKVYNIQCVIMTKLVSQALMQGCITDTSLWYNIFIPLGKPFIKF